jgi:tRNA (adenine57-N1/adenine58-N1)-methyltransferase
VSSDVRVLPDDAWSAEALGERAISDKKIRRVRRDVGQAPAID